MSENKHLQPDYLFEVSWEVCNKVGGIYTVISTKAITLTEELKDNYILIGPDVWMETRNNPEFIEDKYLYRSWREQAEAEGLKLKIGRWNIAGKPVAVLVDFTQFISSKDKIFAEFWEGYELDSLPGQWDYIEPALFGYAASRAIESFYKFNINAHDKMVAQFHEWMTGTGILYLKSHVPQAGCVFTTHATVLGRAIAGNSMPLYKGLETYDGELMARNLGVTAKYSLEKIAARESDSFTTVSGITAEECTHFLNKNVDVITPNGFEDSFIPADEDFATLRNEARENLFTVTEALTGNVIPRDSILILNSGRYEFRNKGIEIFIDSLGRLNRSKDLNKDVIAYIAVPAGNTGPRHDLHEKMLNPALRHQTSEEYLTHWLYDADSDPVLARIRQNGLRNRPEDKVKIIFAPCYLNGDDGIFDRSYYELLIGFDITVFPSYYEPWGYTPLESIAFHIPTITTNLAGFGVWALSFKNKAAQCVYVANRTEDNYNEVTENIAARLMEFAQAPATERKKMGECAFNLSRSALWKNLIEHYREAYSIALSKTELRSRLFAGKQPQETAVAFQGITRVSPEWKKLLVKPSIPESLAALQKLTRNLWWTWNYEAQEMFEMIDKSLWESVHHNPIALIESLSLEDFIKLEKNKIFTDKLNKVYHDFEKYMSRPVNDPERQVAYFSMEFGLHDSLKIYSGGLGILAGDYLKEASDSRRNIVGIGLLYRYGYFAQGISLLGDQLPAYPPQKFSHLPLIPVKHSGDNGNGELGNNWVKIRVAFPGRVVYAKIWKVLVGQVTLFLLDTDFEDNAPEDRAITHRLYGGDSDLRLRQELLLGVGGIRLLDALGVHPNLYHCNEGHAAFIGIERLRKFVQDEKLPFSQAIEVVRASTLFTTHTPVPAGHDTFTEDLLRAYIPHYAERLNLSWDNFMNLGRINDNDHLEKFSMSVLAAKLSSEINGVSRIHGRVSRQLFADLYPGYFPEELHIGYVTNGVHLPTWVSKRWKKLYDTEFGDCYLADQANPDHWKKIYSVPDEKIWQIRQKQRKELVVYLKNRLVEEMTRRQENPKNIFKTSKTLSETTLTIGFARRFATYKRAHLLFSNLERLSRLVNNIDKPVQFVFAGKAHPNDKAGQDLIKKIFEITRRPEFLGKIIFLENYDIDLGKRLVQGVDVWLNTPTRPLEASGTSGEKAIMNGVANFSVLDGWWAEGYKPDAGWALKEERTYQDQPIQDELDAETIYNIIENEIVPAFYVTNDQGIPEKWVSHIKNTIALITPHFTMKRMIDDYYCKYYSKLFRREAEMTGDNFENAKNIAAWKQKIVRGWESIEVVSVNMTDTNKSPLTLGEKFHAEIVLKMNELSGEDIGIEVIFGQKVNDRVERITHMQELAIINNNCNVFTFACDVHAERVGVFDFAFRMFPRNPLLPHRQDFNLLKWL